MRLLVPVAAFVLGAAALAGCLADNESNTGNAGQPDSLPLPPLIDGYPEGAVDPFLHHSAADHADPTKHELAFNLVQTSHHALGGNVARSSGAHVVDVRGDWLFVGTYGQVVDAQGGLWIFDIESDPEVPVLAGQFRLPGNVGGDRSLEATVDADYVVLGTEVVDCAGHVNPFAPGLFLIDVTQKDAPMVTDYLPGSVHSVTVHRIGGEDYVFAVMAGDNILRIDRSGPTARFVAVGSVPIGHDATAYDDPLLGLPLLLVAGGGGPMSVYDVSDPSAPERLGQWNVEDRESEPAYLHAVEPHVEGDRRYLVMDSEDWDSMPSPVWVLDATDLEDIRLVGTWVNPGKHPSNAGLGQALAFSTHNPRVEHGLVYLAHYHAGVFVLDITSPAKIAKPQVAGYYLPHEDFGLRPKSSHGAYPFPNVCGFDISQVPNVFDLEVKEGVVYAADLHTGLYTLKAASPSPSPG